MVEIVAGLCPTGGGLGRLGAVGRLVALLARHDPPRAGHGWTRRTPAEPRAAASTGSTGNADDGTESPGQTLDALYQRHSRVVLAYLYARLPALVDAEDALGDVFEAALEACAAGEAPGIGWLMRVASRRVADFYRARQRRPVAPLADDYGEHTAAGPGHDPEERALRAEERGELRELVARLPEDQREALALRFAAGLRSQEIAAVMGRSDEAIRALLSRALRRLRKEWAR